MIRTRAVLAAISVAVGRDVVYSRVLGSRCHRTFHIVPACAMIIATTRTSAAPQWSAGALARTLLEKLKSDQTKST